jgi:hypothetical protein
MDLRPHLRGSPSLRGGLGLFLWTLCLLVRRSTASQYCKTAETTVCESLLRDETPKYWAP